MTSVVHTSSSFHKKERWNIINSLHNDVTIVSLMGILVNRLSMSSEARIWMNLSVVFILYLFGK